MTSPPPVPAAEADRLARLRDLFVLDSAPEPVFDAIAQLASKVCGVPIALLSLIDSERQWFKANVGLPGVNETPRDVAFCAHAIASDAMFEVPDATRDPRFAANPLVTGAPDIRFYAGAPLVLAGGERVGTLCVIDREMRKLDAHQAQMLSELAAIATQALTMRRDLIVKSLSVRTEYELAMAESDARHRKLVDEQIELVSLARPDGELLYANPAYARHFGRTPSAMVGANLFRFIDPADRDAVRDLVAGVLATGESRSSENRMVAADGSEHWVAWTNSLQHDGQGQPLLHSVGRDVTERNRAERALRASQSFLSRTGRVAGVGGWEVDLATSAITWSDETRRIHGVGPDYQPVLETAISFYAPQARPRIEAAVQAGIESGTPWDLELPFITAAGQHIWVRSVGEVEFEHGRAVRLVGAFQDITERKQLERATRELTAIFDNTTDFVVQTDARGAVRFMNAAARRALGISDAEPMTHRNFAEFNTPATNRHFAETIVPALRSGDVWIGENTVYLEGRRELTVNQMVLAHRDADGLIDRYSSVMRDITSEVQAKQAIQRQTATLRSVTEALPAIVAVVDADGCYRFVNSAFERWSGTQRDRIIGRTLPEVLGRADHERSQPWVDRALAGETVTFERAYSGRNVVKHLSVSYFPLWLDNGTVDGFVGVAQDITLQKQEEHRLLQLTHRDPLTGLLNRAGFEEFMQRCVAQGETESLGLLYIDLDRFKPVNDTHGHPVGDQVLQLLAQRLLRLVRPTDGVARLGGDEFAVVLPGVREASNAQAIAAKVIAAAQAPFEIGAVQVHIGASVGVAVGVTVGATVGVTEGADWQELVARADALLYQAKQAGRGRAAGEGR